MVIIWVAPQKLQKGLSLKALLLILYIAIGLVSVSILVWWYFLLMNYLWMQKKSLSLDQLALYPNIKNALQVSNWFPQDQTESKIIPNVLQLYINKVTALKQLETYSNEIQQPYNNLLQDFLLPPLNIWKDKYTNKINETLVGQNFLKNNTYLDVNLISQWTDFFKNIGVDSLKNDIKSINVWTVKEWSNGTFTIWIDVSFTAQTKRSFLLFVDKMSITSNRENVALLNNFFFNLWGVLKEKYNTTNDAEVWKKISEWVFDPNADNPEKKNKYIASNDIVKAIKRTANCEEGMKMSTCYYMFREKMRAVPPFAYTIGADLSNKENELRVFLQNLPPMMNVKSFVFQKQNDGSYDGQISVEAYGRSMSDSEVQEIAAFLGAKCANNNMVLSPSVAISQLDEVIKKTSSSQINNEQTKDLADLRAAFQSISQKYDSLPGFQKTVQLFSLYRMLSENNMCQSTK